MAKTLKELEERSIYIIRETKANFKNPAVMWSTGKDSTAILQLCKKAFFGKIPFPVIFINTMRKFPEMYAFIDRMKKEWNLDLIEAKNEKAINEVSPEKDRFECCNKLKTEVLRNLINEKKFDAIIVSIRRDEHGIRAKERFFSPRDQDFKWNYKNQPAEMWDMFMKQSDDQTHIRVHPILEWTELNVWEFIRKEKIPMNPLYFSKNGKRYRSLGCLPCTLPIDSDAKTIDEIIEELKTTQLAERAGRAQDKEKTYAMQRLRSLGYM